MTRSHSNARRRGSLCRGQLRALQNPQRIATQQRLRSGRLYENLQKKNLKRKNLKKKKKKLKKKKLKKKKKISHANPFTDLNRLSLIFKLLHECSAQ